MKLDLRKQDLEKIRVVGTNDGFVIRMDTPAENQEKIIIDGSTVKKDGKIWIKENKENEFSVGYDKKMNVIKIQRNYEDVETKLGVDFGDIIKTLNGLIESEHTAKQNPQLGVNLDSIHEKRLLENLNNDIIENLQKMSKQETKDESNVIFDIVGDLQNFQFRDDSNKKEITKSEKTPIGLKPLRNFQADRKKEILAAMKRFLEVGKIPPDVWFEEYLEY